MNSYDFSAIKNAMARSYRHTLLEALEETDVFDTRGNLVIGKDLKVRHKKSQFEYTVDDVSVDDDTGNVSITLRLPDEPRVEPASGEEVIIDSTTHVGPPNTVIDQHASIDLSDGTVEDVVFVIDKKEFEKEYEVK